MNAVTTLNLPAMKYRKLRIALSAACGVLCLLLIALWVRSYWWADAIWYRPTNSNAFRVMSDEGGFTFLAMSDFDVRVMGDPPPSGWSHRRYRLADYAANTADAAPLQNIFRGFRCHKRATWQLPYWVVIASPIALGIITWSPCWQWRFSLRTLLIATTLFAVMLGAIIYAAK